jgi:hypothetical protein
MLFREVIRVYCESSMKHISRLSEQNAGPALCYKGLHYYMQRAVLLPQIQLCTHENGFDSCGGGVGRSNRCTPFKNT